MSDGKSIPEVTNISIHGIRLLLDEREFFLPLDEFPWFREATVRSIHNVVRPMPQHLHWPDLDVDLHVDSLSNPHDYPLAWTAE
jgi:hypothetical protein